MSDYLTSEQRQTAINNITSYFQDVNDEEIGIIAAENILDLFLDKIAKDVYQKGVKDSQKLIKEFRYNLDLELELLSKD